MVETGDREVAERALLTVLQKAQVPVSWRAPIAAELLPLFEEAAPQKPKGRGPLGLIVGRWVIRDDDLSLLDWIAPVVITLSAASVAHSPSYTTSAVLGTIAAVLRFARTLTRKGATLGETEVKVLAAIKTAEDGLTTEALFHKLGERGVETLSQVEDALAGLKEVRTKTGLLALVSQDREGRWVANGV